MKDALSTDALCRAFNRSTTKTEPLSEAALFQMPAQQGHVFHVSPKRYVESVPKQGNGTDGRVEGHVGNHPRNQFKRKVTTLLMAVERLNDMEKLSGQH